METRVAVLSIIVENEDAVSELNELLHRFGKFIIGRMGLPYRQKNVNIICIAIDAPKAGTRQKNRPLVLLLTEYCPTSPDAETDT